VRIAGAPTKSSRHARLIARLSLEPAAVIFASPPTGNHFLAQLRMFASGEGVGRDGSGPLGGRDAVPYDAIGSAAGNARLVIAWASGARTRVTGVARNAVCCGHERRRGLYVNATLSRSPPAPRDLDSLRPRRRSSYSRTTRIQRRRSAVARLAHAGRRADRHARGAHGRRVPCRRGCGVAFARCRQEVSQRCAALVDWL